MALPHADGDYPHSLRARNSLMTQPIPLICRCPCNLYILNAPITYTDFVYGNPSFFLYNPESPIKNGQFYSTVDQRWRGELGRVVATSELLPMGVIKAPLCNVRSKNFRIHVTDVLDLFVPHKPKLPHATHCESLEALLAFMAGVHLPLER
jgi:hypothetical protein